MKRTDRQVLFTILFGLFSGITFIPLGLMLSLAVSAGKVPALTAWTLSLIHI